MNIIEGKIVARMKRMANPCSGSGAGVYTLYHGDLRGVAHPQGDDRAADAVGGYPRAPVDAGDSRAGDQTDRKQPAPERLRTAECPHRDGLPLGDACKCPSIHAVPPMYTMRQKLPWCKTKGERMFYTT